MTGEIFSRRIEVVNFIEERVIRQYLGKLFFYLSKIIADTGFIQFSNFDSDLNRKGMSVYFLTFSLVIL